MNRQYLSLLFLLPFISAQMIFSTDVFVPGEETIQAEAYCYRIPSISNLGNGRLIAFAEARVYSCGDNGPKNIVFKISENSGKTWGAARVLNPTDVNTTVWGNPTPYYDANLNMLIVQVIEQTRGRTYQFVSMNQGESFIRETALQTTELGFPAIYPGPGQGIRLQNGPRAGRIVFCGWFQRLSGEYDTVAWYSDDNGNSYVPSQMDATTLDIFANSECQPVEYQNGSVAIYVRAVADNIFMALSNDGATSFGPKTPQEEMFSVVIQFGFIYHDGLFYWSISNGITRFGNARGALTVFSSANGQTDWTVVQQITAGPSGYNNLVGLDSRTMGCLYEIGGVFYSEKISYSAFYLE